MARYAVEPFFVAVLRTSAVQGLADPVAGLDGAVAAHYLVSMLTIDTFKLVGDAHGVASVAIEVRVLII